MQPFIGNHQQNVIRSQARFLLQSLRTVTDRSMLEVVRTNAEHRVLSAFPGATAEQVELLRGVLRLSKDEELTAALATLDPFVAPAPALTEADVRRLFPKAKKLKLPPLESIDFRKTTYVSWLDIGADKMYLAYSKDGRWIGVEGRVTPVNKKNVCAICNGHGEVGLFTSVTKARMKNNPDYYKAVGNYICLDAAACNERITDLEPLETFLANVTG